MLPDGPPDDRFAYLSGILPTAWQGVEHADVPEGGTLVVLGLGPIGDFASRIARHKGYRVIGVDRLEALYSAIDIVRRGGTISLTGVYGGVADPIPMLTIFDKQIQLRGGQANIKRWIPDIMPLLDSDDPLGCDTFATHRVPLSEAPEMYRKFQEKADGVVKVQLKPEQ